MRPRLGQAGCDPAGPLPEMQAAELGHEVDGRGAAANREEEGNQMTQDERFDRIDAALERLGGRFDQVEVRLGQVEKRLGQVEKRLDQVDRRLDQMDARLDQVDRRLGQIDNYIQHFRSEMIGRLDRIDHRLDGLSATLVSLDLRQPALTKLVLDADVSPRNRLRNSENSRIA
jgi:chromosome segregation ATPase